MKRIKRAVGFVAAWMVLVPLMPGLLLAMAFEALARFLDWLHADRSLTIKLVELADGIDRWRMR